MFNWILLRNLHSPCSLESKKLLISLTHQRKYTIRFFLIFKVFFVDAVNVQLEKLRIAINIEKTEFYQAISDGKKFCDVIKIYAKIKKLENMAGWCLQDMLS